MDWIPELLREAVEDLETLIAQALQEQSKYHKAIERYLEMGGDPDFYVLSRKTYDRDFSRCVAQVVVEELEEVCVELAQDGVLQHKRAIELITKRHRNLKRTTSNE